MGVPVFWRITACAVAASLLSGACSDDPETESGSKQTPLVPLMSGSDAGKAWTLYLRDDRDGSTVCVLAEDLEAPACMFALRDPAAQKEALSMSRFTLSEDQGRREYVAGTVTSKVGSLEVRLFDSSVVGGIPIAWLPDRPLGVFLGVFAGDPAGGFAVESVSALDPNGKVLTTRR